MNEDILIRNNISKHLSSFREANDLSKKDMALALGVNPSTYRSWETARSAPKRSALTLISKVIGIPIDELLGSESYSFEVNSSDDVYGDKYLSELSNEEKIFVMKYRQFNNIDKKKLSDFLDEIQNNK